MKISKKQYDIPTDCLRTHPTASVSYRLSIAKKVLTTRHERNVNVRISATNVHLKLDGVSLLMPRPAVKQLLQSRASQTISSFV